jgi:hypothetical protein
MLARVQRLQKERVRQVRCCYQREALSAVCDISEESKEMVVACVVDGAIGCPSGVLGLRR